MGLVDGRGHRRLIADVDVEIAGLVGTQPGNGGSALVVVEVEQGHLAALGDEVLGHGQAEAGDAASDHGTYGRQLH